tara:strand:+ start:1175 stop:1864 length:690 start_codon:yes stop_codon:yes gene_type:complete
MKEYIFILHSLFTYYSLKNIKKIKSKYYNNYLLIHQLTIFFCFLNLKSISKKTVSLIYLFRLINLVSLMPNICRFNNGVLSTPIFNRTVAAIGELLFVKILDNRLFNIAILAELFSYTAMFTKNCFYFLCENSLWTFGIALYSIINYKNKLTLMFTLPYLYYMINKNLPMYYHQWKIKKYGNPKSIINGFIDSFRQMDKLELGPKWNECLEWSILNFIFLPIFLVLNDG